MAAIDIPDLVFQTYFDNADAMIDKWFGVNCVLLYPSTKSICPNCIYNPVTEQSTGVYNGSGPVAFEDTVCPYCNGYGYITAENTDTIKLRIYPEKKNWIKLPIELRVPANAIQVFGHIDDMPKVQKADVIIINSDLAGLGGNSYRLAGEPVFHGFKKKKYFIAMLERHNA